MRQELALLIALGVGGLGATLASLLLGDSLAWYATILSWLAYPFFIFFGSMLVLTVRGVLIKFKRYNCFNLSIGGMVVAVFFGMFIGSGGHWEAGVVFGIGVFISFFAFAYLTKPKHA